jgi:hypothetical protein
MLIKVKPLACFSLFLFSILLFTNVCIAASATIMVQAGKTISTEVDLNVEDEVTGRISVIGIELGGINFTVIGPSGQTVMPTQMIKVTDFKFIATEKGVHTFLFDNSLSSDDKTVSFNYDVKHYWFGMPQEFFLMLIVVLLGVLALIIYAKASNG